MIELIMHIIKQLVDDPEKVKIEEQEENGIVVYCVNVAVEDRGRVIGREGKTIKAIRALVSAASSKLGRKSAVKIVD